MEKQLEKSTMDLTKNNSRSFC